MKLAFISDIHGNAIALDAVRQDIKEKNVDKIFVLGDISFRGPEPKRALDLVRALKCEVIKGNADEWVVRGLREGEVPDQALEVMTKERDWTYSQLDDESIEYLRNLPLELTVEVRNIKIHAFHATPNSLFEVVPPFESDSMMSEKLMINEADIYIYAHIHKPYIRYINGKCLINIGSVGLPFDGMNKSSYSLIDIRDGSFQTSIVRVDYDVKQVIHQFRESDYPNVELMTNLLLKAKL
ncbi:YfcE family phosphodiesterase [Bacillus aerolatus]|uniref:YfcE family phosphodiesterase n=1 Tax=Bacillus aerolatus TaxID=2653354 RepID=A0A6I1FIM7_9BACI|nr:metallophosphoesterase family protein [Bacillus aerolatus]KAB7708182.1 YfcE family phosphodiesterase [Bacillus aerolatus]